MSSVQRNKSSPQAFPQEYIFIFKDTVIIQLLSKFLTSIHLLDSFRLHLVEPIAVGMENPWSQIHRQIFADSKWLRVYTNKLRTNFTRNSYAVGSVVNSIHQSWHISSWIGFLRHFSQTQPTVHFFHLRRRRCVLIQTWYNHFIYLMIYCDNCIDISCSTV